jgi:hypothetical protein
MCNEGYPCFWFIFSQPIVDTGGGGIREQLVDLQYPLLFISLQGYKNFGSSIRLRIGIVISVGTSVGRSPLIPFFQV